MIGRIRARDHGLRAQHFQRPFLARLRAHHTDHVVFQAKLVHHDEPLAAAHDLERCGIVAAVQPDHVLAAQAERRSAAAVDLDGAAHNTRVHDLGTPGAGRARPERDDLDVHAAELGGARAVHHGDTNRALARGRIRVSHSKRNDCERDTPSRPRGTRYNNAQRRPNSQNSSESTTESSSDVASGK